MGRLATAVAVHTKGSGPDEGVDEPQLDGSLCRCRTTSTNAPNVLPHLTLITAALAASSTNSMQPWASGTRRFPQRMTAAANAAVVVAAIVASIPGIITEAAALLPAAVAIPQRSSQRLCSKWHSGWAGAQ